MEAVVDRLADALRSLPPVPSAGEQAALVAAATGGGVCVRACPSAARVALRIPPRTHAAAAGCGGAAAAAAPRRGSDGPPGGRGGGGGGSTPAAALDALDALAISTKPKGGKR